jgi:hypothetical protein
LLLKHFSACVSSFPHKSAFFRTAACFAPATWAAEAKHHIDFMDINCKGCFFMDIFPWQSRQPTAYIENITGLSLVSQTAWRCLKNSHHFIRQNIMHPLLAFVFSGNPL